MVFDTFYPDDDGGLEEYPCPECGEEMSMVIFDGYGSGFECEECGHQILMEDEDLDDFGF